MGFFDQRFSAESLKAAALTAKAKIESGASSIVDTTNAIGAKAAELTSSASDAVRNHDYDSVKKKALEKALQLRDDASDLKDKAVNAAQNFDFDETKESLSSLSKEATHKLTKYIRGTFEVDKSTFDMVQDIRRRLPMPAKSMDEIYDQCRDEAVRRAIATFMLGDILDKRSEARYGKLTDTFDEYRTSEAKQYIGVANSNYKDMKPAEGELVINSYNTSETILHSRETGHKVAVEHVTARNTIFQNRLLAAGLTDEQLGDVMNDPRNLAHINRSVNSQKSDLDFDTWLNKFGVQDPKDPDKVIITIQNTGETHIISRKDVAEAEQQSKRAVRDGQIQAVKEIGKTMAMTGDHGSTTGRRPNHRRNYRHFHE